MESEGHPLINPGEQRIKLKKQVIFSLFVAIILLLSFTPLGFIQLVFIKATSVHIPVILGGLLLGPGYGAALGAVFGLTSLINNSINPSLLSFCFSPLIPVPGSASGSALSLIIAFGPRILTGFLPGLLMQGVKKFMAKRGKPLTPVHLGVAGAVLGGFGALCNTIPVMTLIYLFFAPALAQLKGLSGDAVLTFVLGVISTNGIPEMIVSGVFSAVALPILYRFTVKKT